MAKSINRAKYAKDFKNREQETESSNEVKIQRGPALSGWPMILAWLAMLIFAFHSSTHMVGAGDTWVAMACGRHFINHGVDTVEPFSANSHRPGPTAAEIAKWPGWARWIAGKVGPKTLKYWHPTGWVNQNWLTHVIFYWLTHESPIADPDTFPPSFNQLVYWKIAIYILSVICVYYTGRILGANPALSAVFACFAMFVGRSFFDVRPAGFSNLLVAVFLLILVLTTYRNILYIWLIVPVVVFWCNVHGGYIYAFIMLVPFAGLHLLINLPKKWRAILYNVTAWPFFFFVVSRIDFKKVPESELGSLQLKMFLLLVSLIILDIVLIFFRDKLVSIKRKGFYHTIAAGFIGFIATIVFNPFHLTNLTHTFVISFSKHAEMWRTVNEWHPAFEWTNPVGTSFPFLVLYLLSIGLTLLWLLSRLLKPRLLKAPKNELQAQKKLFETLSTILGCGAAVLICWATLISFSLLNFSAADFIISAAFVAVLLLSIYRNVHFISLIIPLILLVMGFVDPYWIKVFSQWFNSPELLRNIPRGYNGRYIYPFILLPAYVILYIFASLFSKSIKIKRKLIIFPVIAAVATLFLMMLIFNPFGFKIPAWTMKPAEGFFSSIGSWFRAVINWLISWHASLGQFLNFRRLMRPVYESNVEVSYTHLFKTIYFINILSIIIWLMLPYLRRLFAQVAEKTDKEPPQNTYRLPKIDLALITIAVLTTYMAIQSRRFIPIAAFAACPVLAMFIDQMVRTISSARNFHMQNRLTVSPMPEVLKWFFIVAGAAAVFISGTGWGLQFKRVYLDAWPTDSKLNSVFMRMTASDAKPFYACQFIRDNNMQGKIFNYWTEGGFIAYGQNPDPNTGRTPLQLFMDGRAQAAYQPAAYRLWSDIMAGGPTVYVASQKAKLTGKTTQEILTAKDYKDIGEWIDKRLKERKVWVVLMPTGQFETPFVKGLEYNTSWPVVFYNDKQKMFVDATTPQGKKIFEGTFTGKTIYSDEFSRNLIKAQNWFSITEDTNARKQALEFAKEAFRLTQSQAPMRQIMSATRFPELRAEVERFCKDYFDQFEENRGLWAKQHGYHHRIAAALNVCSYFRELAKRQKDMKLVQFYDAKMSLYQSERQQLLNRKRW
jgi:hypothetical protein